jgi:hypothetical protein
MAGIALALAWLACVGSDPTTNDGGGNDAAPDGTSSGDDAGVDAETGPPPRCDVTKDFGTAIPVDEIATPDDEDGARLTGDELTIFFTRVGGVTKQIYRAQRNTPDGPWGPSAVVVPHLGSSQSNPRDPSPSPDGSFLFWVSDAVGIGGIDIYRSALGDGGVYGPGTVLPPPVSTGLTEHQVFLRADARMLYFASVRLEPDQAIYRSAIAGESYGDPVLVSPKPVDVPHSFPAAPADGRALYFAKPGSNGRSRIHVMRGAAEDTLGPPKEVVELNSPGGGEWPSWVSGDDCVIYFSIDRLNDAGNSGTDVWMAKRPPL